MALDPMELLVLGVGVLVLLLWGPQKVPEIARSLGQAKKQLDAATKDFSQVTGQLTNPTAGGLLDSLAKLATTPAPTAAKAAPSMMASAQAQAQAQAPPVSPTTTNAPAASPPMIINVPKTVPRAADGQVAQPESTAQSAGAAQPANPLAPGAAAPRAQDSMSADEVLVDTARKLGISTEGKTRAEISGEIVAKAKGGAYV